MSMVTEIGVKPCRDCGEPVPMTCRTLCDACQAIAEARRKEHRRLQQRERSMSKRNEQRVLKAAGKEEKAAAPRICATEGCHALLEGSERYCLACRRRRMERAQRLYRSYGPYVDYLLPDGPPTSMVWLGRFKAWTKSGMSYGDYQAAERAAADAKAQKRRPPKNKK